MALSPYRPGSLTRTNSDLFVSMRREMTSLQRQLQTGQRADTYGGLGYARSTSLDMRARLSAVEGYKATIDQTELRLKMMTQNLERLNTLGQDTKSDMTLAKFDLLSDGTTFAQKNAEQRFKEVVDLLNADIAGRSLFAGRTVDKLPMESFDRIMNGDGARAGLKTLINERKLADLGADNRGRLTLSHTGGTSLITLAEDASAGVRANFGFSIKGVQVVGSSAITATTTAGTASSVSLGNQPADGQRLQVTVNQPDGSREVVELVARTTPNPSAVPKEFAIGASAAASSTNLMAALGGGTVAAVQSSPDLAATITGGSAASVALDVTTQPTAGDIVRITLGMRDGTTKVIELTARASADPASTTEFAIGASATATADALNGALDRAIQDAAKTSLAATSAVMASGEFFAGSPSTPPLRAGAAGMVAGTAANTLIWYSGDDDPTISSRNTAPVRIDQGQVVATGARANEPGIRNVLAQLGVLAASTFVNTKTDAERYRVMTEKVFDKLADKPGNPKVSDIATELANAAATMKATKERHASTESMVYDALDGVEGVNKEEVAMGIMELQNRLEASYQTTSMLSRLSLVNYL